MTSPQGGGENRLSLPDLPVFYMKMNEANVDARMGKMQRGKVYPMTQDMATRFLMAGIAEQVGRGEYDNQRQGQQDRLSQRQQAFLQLNQAHALWDTSTHRDVLTAPEDGLRRAYEAGMPLSNLDYLRDEDGQALTQDASIEQILEARQLLSVNAQFPLQAHDRSSVQGGGSHFTNPYAVQGGPQPLAPKYREQAQQIAENELFAQRPQALADQADANRSPDQGVPGRQGRSVRRSQTLQGAQGAPSGGQGAPPPPPRPGISPQAAEQAQAHNVPPPEPGTPEQTGNR